MDKTVQELVDGFSNYVIEVLRLQFEEGDFDERLTRRMNDYEIDNNCELTDEEIDYIYKNIDTKVREAGFDIDVFKL